jgi:predicted DsbA family dithiol-disulfide isomerase
MVEGSEFPFLVVKYQVHGVPHTVINETYSVVGAPSEVEFAQEILKAMGT